MTMDRFHSVTLHICASCGLPVEENRPWHKILLVCQRCRSLVRDQSDPIVNPVAVLETVGAGTSSYLACLHAHLMRGQKKVRSTQGAFDRMTRVFLSGERLPAWAARQNLPKSVYRPFTFEWASRAIHLVAGPAFPSQIFPDENDDSNWLSLVRQCSAVIVSLRMPTLSRMDAESARALDRQLASRLRTMLEHKAKVRRAVLMLNAADVAATGPADAESLAAELLHRQFTTVHAVATNAEVSVFAVPNSTWGFGVTPSDRLRFPSDAHPFNTLEPVRCALGDSTAPGLPPPQHVATDSSQTSTESKSFERTTGDFDFALSYASEDSVYVTQVAECLRQAGVRVYFDRFEHGAMWGEDLASRLGTIYRDGSRYVVVFVSQHYAEKYWTQHERRHIASRLTGPKAATVLHARFDATELPGLDPDLVYLDLRQRSPANVAELLVSRLRATGSAFSPQPPPAK